MTQKPTSESQDIKVEAEELAAQKQLNEVENLIETEELLIIENKDLNVDENQNETVNPCSAKIVSNQTTENKDLDIEEIPIETEHPDGARLYSDDDQNSFPDPP